MSHRKEKIAACAKEVYDSLIKWPSPLCTLLAEYAIPSAFCWKQAQFPAIDLFADGHSLSLRDEYISQGMNGGLGGNFIRIVTEDTIASSGNSEWEICVRRKRNVSNIYFSLEFLEDEQNGQSWYHGIRVDGSCGGENRFYYHKSDSPWYKSGTNYVSPREAVYPEVKRTVKRERSTKTPIRFSCNLSTGTILVELIDGPTKVFLSELYMKPELLAHARPVAYLWGCDTVVDIYEAPRDPVCVE